MAALPIPSVEEADVRAKRVLLRLDLNVPMADGRVSDATRIERVLPTVRDLAARGAKVVVLSHFGRPKGRPVAAMSLRPVAEALAEALARPVAFAEDCIGAPAETVVAGLGEGDVALLENVRFHPGEEKNDPDFARALAALGDIYVNDAFSAAHRAHASTEGLARLLPAYAGPSMLAEIAALTRALEAPERPVAALIAGAKISTKMGVLGHLLSKVDALIIGGGMANTFLLAQGHDIGRSLAEPELAEEARAVLAQARRTGCEVVLPLDAVVAGELKEGAAHSTCPVEAVPSDAMILDIGPQTVAVLKARLESLRTLLWNGPLGAFEVAPFGEGTFAVARAAAERTRSGTLVTVAGGGDTVAALNAAGVAGDFTYVSTAGGAFLEWLEGRELPGVAVLVRR